MGASLQGPRLGYSVNGLESVSKGMHRLDVVMAIVPEDYGQKLLLEETGHPPDYGGPTITAKQMNRRQDSRAGIARVALRDLK